MTVYVLKFSAPLGDRYNPKGHAQTYTGYCRASDPYRRLRRHESGDGAAITRAAVENGIDLRVAAYIPGATSADERRIKRWGCMPRLLERWSKNPVYKDANGKTFPVILPGKGEAGIW